MPSFWLQCWATVSLAINPMVMYISVLMLGIHEFDAQLLEPVLGDGMHMHDFLELDRELNLCAPLLIDAIEHKI